MFREGEWGRATILVTPNPSKPLILLLPPPLRCASQLIFRLCLRPIHATRNHIWATDTVLARVHRVDLRGPEDLA